MWRSVRPWLEATHLKALADHCLAVLEGRALCQEGDDEEARAYTRPLQSST